MPSHWLIASYDTRSLGAKRSGVFKMRAIIACVLLCAAQSVSAQTGSVANALVAETANFQLVCYDGALCASSNISKAETDNGQKALEQLQSVRAWLDGLGFPVHREDLPDGTDGKKLIYYLSRTAPADAGCGANAAACFFPVTASFFGRSYIVLPAENSLDYVDGETITHEYVHSFQVLQTNEKTAWIDEMVATAIESAWLRKTKPGFNDVYTPYYNMTLDRPFWKGDDAGYGKWDYAIRVGQRMSSKDTIAYLADDAFLRIGSLGKTDDKNNMGLWFDPDLVQGATFDAVFPAYVAVYNNIQTSTVTATRTSKYLYYGDINKVEIKIPHTDAEYKDFVSGTVGPYTADPNLVTLSVTPTPDRPEKDNVLLARVEIAPTDEADGTEDLEHLTLITEHRLAAQRQKDFFLLDGNNPPKDGVFFRVASTPPIDEVSAVSMAAGTGKVYHLNVTTTPVEFDVPDGCFEPGQSYPIEVKGLEDYNPSNWNITSDNGTVEDLRFTPERRGKLELTLNIESPVTRRSIGLQKKRPDTTEVSLGTFDIVDGECMIRMTAGPSIMTYVFDGEYTEATSPNEPAAYFSRTDMAFYDGQWRELPVFARQMMVQSIQNNMATGRIRNQGQLIEPGDDMMAQTPYVFSKFFSWNRMRELSAPSGFQAKRSATACPDTNNSGCFAAEFVFEGNRIPITYNANGQPVRVTMSGQTMKFEYGYWDVRRPPGW